METIYLVLLLIAIVSIIVICLCCCACWCPYHQNTHKKNKVLHDIEAGHPINTEKVKPKQWDIEITDLEDSTSDSHTTDIEPLLDSTDGKAKKEHAIATKADKEHGTLLWINTDLDYYDPVYLNTPGGPHAELMFINDPLNKPNHIKALWIKNSPCADCSRALLEYFNSCRKPTIYVGRIWHLYDINDDQGLVHLMKAGFKITVWETLHTMMYGSDQMTANYLHKLETQTREGHY